MKNLMCASVTVGLIALLCPAATAAGPVTVPAGAMTVLDGVGTYWRWMKADRPAVLVAEAAAAERVTVKNKKIPAAEANAFSVAVPAGWRAADFDDASWPRTAGRRLENLAFVNDSMDMSHGLPAYCRTALLCLRGKFRVADPKAVEALYLTLNYRGGVVVHLNGREIARGHLPAGELTPVTPGAAYPTEAFVGEKGKPLPWPKRVGRDQKEAFRRIGLRRRKLGPIAVPAAAIRKGANVLAVTIHRSDFDPAAKVWFRKYTRGGWTTLALTGLKFQAVGGGASVNIGRPTGGAAVFNPDRNDRTSVYDYRDPTEPLRPVVLTGARNGTFSGKVVVASDAAIEGLRAAAGELKAVKGGGVIDASAAAVRYSEPVFGKRSLYLEPLSPTAPATIAVQRKAGAAAAVWVAVTVPADSAAGDYRGTLTVSAGGKKLADVPIDLHVADWALPAPRDFRTFVGVYQSPRALSLTYKTPMWSAKHWKLMDRSMALLGGLGGDMAQIPLVERTRLGNVAGWVVWVRQADGTYQHDFDLAEKYLKLVKRHLGVPRFVVLHLWHAGGWTAMGAKQANTVTVRDAKTGKTESLQVPEFGTAESKAFWTPVLLGMKKRLAAEGMAGALCLGSLAEGYPSEPVSRMFTEILGEAKWMRTTHAAHGALSRPNRALPGGGSVSLHIYTYLAGLPDPAKPMAPLNQPYWPRVAYYRRAQRTTASLIFHRLMPAEAIYRRLPGFSHACLDYWLCPAASKHRGGMLFGSHIGAGNYPGDPEPTYITWPGPDGAEPLTAYEALREGLQETEAIMAIAEALAKRPGALGADLAAECRKVLLDYLAFARTRNQMRYQHVHAHMNHYGWQDISRRLFELAARVTVRK